jgi:uncharacterized OB-fold protein
VAEVKQVLIGEGLFAVSEGKTSLIVTHCRTCGDYFFPKTFTCHNPECKDKEVEDVPLSRRGKVENYSVMNYPPPPPFVAKEPYEPIVCASVAFPEGIMIIGMMEGTTAEEVKIGMDVEVTVGALYTNKKDEEIIAWKFKAI